MVVVLLRCCVVAGVDVDVADCDAALAPAEDGNEHVRGEEDSLRPSYHHHRPNRCCCFRCRHGRHHLRWIGEMDCHHELAVESFGIVRVVEVSAEAVGAIAMKQMPSFAAAFAERPDSGYGTLQYQQ